MHRWWKRPDAGKGHGRVTLQFDDETPYVIWFDEEIRRAPAEFDRFGLFNIARFGTRVEMYLGDLTVNGQKIDLSQDPHWEGRNNESRYTEPNFQAMHSYGWSQTNWAGEKPGEIGGLFWRTEPPDPLCSYYGDDVGELTLDDPISFSGTICFTDGMTDAAAYFGYFNRDNQVEAFDKARSDAFSPGRQHDGRRHRRQLGGGLLLPAPGVVREAGRSAEVLRGLHARPPAAPVHASTTTRRATAGRAGDRDARRAASTCST